MGLFKRGGKRRDDEIVDPEDRSPVTGLKYKDLQLLGVIKDHGSDLSAPRHVLHYLYFPSRSSAESAGEEIRRHGWSAEVRDPLPDYPGQWAVVAEQAAAVLTIEFVRDSTDLFEQTALNHGGEHDGWEAGPDLPPTS
jgi:hypothetical protein